jgi:hypothetical protein
VIPASFLGFGIPRRVQRKPVSPAEALLPTTEMVAQLLRVCVMILGIETARLVGAALPEFYPAGLLTDVGQQKQVVSAIQTTALVMKLRSKLLAESGLVVAPFRPLVTSKRMA